MMMISCFSVLPDGQLQWRTAQTKYKYNQNNNKQLDKCQYEMQKQKEVPVWYAGIYRTISCTA
jgi:hypothetical protein